MTRLFLALTVSLALTTPAAAQWLDYPTPDLPRTADGKPNLTAATPRGPDGKPDLSGLWILNGLGYNFNIFGAEKVEMLPAAQALFDQRSGTYSKDSPDSNCLPIGPRAGLFGMDPAKFVQTKNVLLILYEDSPTRQVFLDGRPLPQDPNPSWMGYSVGRWDGDTLVVDTIGYNDRTWLDLAGRPHSEALHVTERYRRSDTGHLQLQMTFDDPRSYSRPWTITIDGELLPDSELLEAVCNENEKDSSRYTGNVTVDHATSVAVPPAVLARYAGTYNAGPVGMLRISVTGNGLSLVLPGGGTHGIIAKSEEEFFIPDLGSPVRFLKTATGDVTHLRLTIVEGDIDAPRTP